MASDPVPASTANATIDTLLEFDVSFDVDDYYKQSFTTSEERLRAKNLEIYVA